MPTTTTVFEEVLKQIIPSAREIDINDIYLQISQRVPLTPSDKLLTQVRGNATKEPVWKRNVRNALQKLKSNGRLVNSRPSFWRLPTKNSSSALSEKNAWNVVLHNSHLAFKKKTTWTAPKRDHRYQIISIENNIIRIERKDANKNDHITKAEVERSIRILNASGGTAVRRTLNYTVAKEAAIVFLHDALRWDKSQENIIVSGRAIQQNNIQHQIEEALNDNPENFQVAARKVRKGQRRLRNNLLYLYSQQCCISKTGPSNVLQAAHIKGHSVTGDNNSQNALLMRSDLHDLFDDNLIAIHPVELKVLVHPSLKETIYYSYQHSTLKKRVDAKKPSQQALQERWDTLDWV